MSAVNSTALLRLALMKRYCSLYDAPMTLRLRRVAPASPEACITTLHGLNNALSRERAEGLNSRDSSPKRRSAPLASARRQGLDKVAGMHALKELLRREVVAPIRNPEPYRR